MLSEARDRERALSLLQDKDRRAAGDAATLHAQLAVLKDQLLAADAEYGQQRARAQAEVAALEARGRQDAAEVDALTRRVVHLEAQVGHLQGSEQQATAALDDLQQRHNALVAAKAAAERHLQQASADKERAEAALADALQDRARAERSGSDREAYLQHTVDELRHQATAQVRLPTACQCCGPFLLSRKALLAHRPPRSIAPRPNGTRRDGTSPRSDATQTPSWRACGRR